MIPKPTHDASVKLAQKIIDLFAEEDVSEEVALHAMTQVIATVLVDQSDVEGKIVALLKNLAIWHQTFRDKLPPERVLSS